MQLRANRYKILTMDPLQAQATMEEFAAVWSAYKREKAAAGLEGSRSSSSASSSGLMPDPPKTRDPDNRDLYSAGNSYKALSGSWVFGGSTTRASTFSAPPCRRR